MNVDRAIVDGGCNEEVLSDSVTGKKRVGGNADEENGVKNGDEGDKSSTTRVTRTVLMDIGVIWEGVCWKDFG